MVPDAIRQMGLDPERVRGEIDIAMPSIAGSSGDEN